MSETETEQRLVLDQIEPGGDWQRISPKHMVDQFVTLGSVFLLVLAVSVTIILLGNIVPPFTAWALFVIVVVGGVANLILVPFQVRAMRYLLRPDDFVYCRGVIFRRQVAVPYGRLQLVDISRGPLARALGLAEIRLVTASASTGVTIPGVVLADAEWLRDQLVALAETRRAGL